MAVLVRLPWRFTASMPRMLILVLVLSIVSGTSGWFLTKPMGYLDMDRPGILWVYGARVVVTILSGQGLGLALATNPFIYFKLQKPENNDANTDRCDAIYGGGQPGVRQMAIIVAIARFSTGLWQWAS